MKPLQNCVYCGGDLANELGVYVSSEGWKHTCGFCNGTGKVPYGSQFVESSIPVDKPKKKAVDVGQLVLVICGVMFGTAFLISMGYIIVSLFFSH